jgi:hypothetical protein
MEQNVDKRLVVYTLAEAKSTYRLDPRMLKNLHKKGEVNLSMLGGKYYISQLEIERLILGEGELKC